MSKAQPKEGMGRGIEIPTIAELDEIVRKLSAKNANTTPPSHVAPTPQMQKIIQHMRIRAFGCDDAGNVLERKKLIEDYSIVEELERPLVIDPSDIKLQLTTFRNDLEEAGGKYNLLDPNKYPFVSEGRHLSLISGQEHVRLHDAIPTRIGLLVEYVRGSFRVPLGYHYVYATMPWAEEGEEDLVPQYNGRKILGTDSEGLQFRRNHEGMMQIARTGVIKSISNEIRDEFSKMGIAIPPELADAPFRRLGFNTWLKRVTARFAELCKKELIVVNIARLRRPDKLMDSAILMPNVASWGANRMFYDLHLKRSVNPKILLDGKSIAEAHLHVHGNTPEATLSILDADDEVLKRKGADIAYLDERAAMLKTVYERRMNE
ncbi:MAG: hypothetical protein KBD00_05330 [Candidatus Peribacteraceae bacterium]|nr:hypothetical protein [Candidatus Peribacteraceae bacterium]